MMGGKRTRVAATCPGLDELGLLLRKASRRKLTRAEVKRGEVLLEWQRGAHSELRALAVEAVQLHSLAEEVLEEVRSWGEMTSGPSRDADLDAAVEPWRDAGYPR